MKQETQSQLALFDFQDPSPESLELLPEIWNRAEELVSGREAVRTRALERIVALKAHRLSPLVAYLLTTRLVESDLDIRFQVVRALGKALIRDQEESLTSPAVRLTLLRSLANMRRRQIYAVLQVADHFLAAEDSVMQLLNACPYAGSVMSDIFNDRKLPVSIRQQAIQFTGLIGFLDAAPGLERLVNRLEERSEQQEKMSFLTVDPLSGEESLLIPAKAALVKLKRKT